MYKKVDLIKLPLIVLLWMIIVVEMVIMIINLANKQQLCYQIGKSDNKRKELRI